MSVPGIVAVTVLRRVEFDSWLARLKDRQAQTRIALRLARLQEGHFGDVRSVGGGVSEMRIDHGPGYRIYFARRDTSVVVLLCAGDKRRQDRDILRARMLNARS